MDEQLTSNVQIVDQVNITKPQAENSAGSYHPKLAAALAKALDI